MRRVIAAVLGMHAIAHLAGFAWPWWLYDVAPFPPTGIAWLGSAAMPLVSIASLVIAGGFITAALNLLHHRRIWRRDAARSAVGSLMLSAACWPGSMLGLPINLVLLGWLIGTRRTPRELAVRR